MPSFFHLKDKEVRIIVTALMRDDIWGYADSEIFLFLSKLSRFSLCFDELSYTAQALFLFEVPIVFAVNAPTGKAASHALAELCEMARSLTSAGVAKRDAKGS